MRGDFFMKRAFIRFSERSRLTRWPLRPKWPFMNSKRLYLATVVDDLYSRKIVGWAMADHMRAELPLAALAMAIATQRPGAGLIHHSDRGVQYASAEYRKVMQSAGFRASMSRRADCYDNAPMESFFHTLELARIDAEPLGGMPEAYRKQPIYYITNRIELDVEKIGVLKNKVERQGDDSRRRLAVHRCVAPSCKLRCQPDRSA
jgi:transposase InsO family protein